MADDTRFRSSYAGIGAMLKAPFMAADMGRRAAAVQAHAEALAPTGDPDDDPHAGRYRESFSTEVGMRSDRAYGRVTNTAPEAVDVEYGGHGTPKYRCLGRALGAAGETGTEPYAPGPARPVPKRYVPPKRGR